MDKRLGVGPVDASGCDQMRSNGEAVSAAVDGAGVAGVVGVVGASGSLWQLRESCWGWQSPEEAVFEKDWASGRAVTNMSMFQESLVGAPLH